MLEVSPTACQHGEEANKDRTGVVTKHKCVMGESRFNFPAGQEMLLQYKRCCKLSLLQGSQQAHFQFEMQIMTRFTVQ